MCTTVDGSNVAANNPTATAFGNDREYILRQLLEGKMPQQQAPQPGLLPAVLEDTTNNAAMNRNISGNPVTIQQVESNLKKKYAVFQSGMQNMMAQRVHLQQTTRTMKTAKAGYYDNWGHYHKPKQRPQSGTVTSRRAGSGLTAVDRVIAISSLNLGKSGNLADSAEDVRLSSDQQALNTSATAGALMPQQQSYPIEAGATVNIMPSQAQKVSGGHHQQRAASAGKVRPSTANASSASNSAHIRADGNYQQLTRTLDESAHVGVYTKPAAGSLKPAEATILVPSR